MRWACLSTLSSGSGGDDVGSLDVQTERASDTVGVKTATALVLVMLATRLHNGHEHKIKAATLADDCGVDVRTIYRALEDLKERGLVECRRTVRSNSYRLSLGAIVSVDVGAERQDVSLHREAGCQSGEGQDVSLEKGRMSVSKKGSVEKVKERVSRAHGFAALESALLDCIPPSRRRGALGLDRASALIAMEMWEEYGPDACFQAARECGGADRPAYMLRSRLFKMKATAPALTAPDSSWRENPDSPEDCARAASLLDGLWGDE